MRRLQGGKSGRKERQHRAAEHWMFYCIDSAPAPRLLIAIIFRESAEKGCSACIVNILPVFVDCGESILYCPDFLSWSGN